MVSSFMDSFMHRRASLVAQMVKICLQWGRPAFYPWVEKIPWWRAWQPIPIFLPGELSGTEEPGRLQSMGYQRVGHDWVAKCVHTHTHTHTHRKNQITLFFNHLSSLEVSQNRKASVSSMPHIMAFQHLASVYSCLANCSFRAHVHEKPTYS